MMSRDIARESRDDYPCTAGHGCEVKKGCEIKISNNNINKRQSLPLYLMIE